MDNNLSLQIVGLSEIELLEFEELAGSPLMPLQTESPSKTEYGDMDLLIAGIQLTAAVVQALAIWLAKRQVTKLSQLSIEKHADQMVKLDMTQMSCGSVNDTPDPQVVESLKVQLSDLFKLRT